tara:strand:- start:387 stop:1418 length:1032 start_codon:yes stop_codon:yes gene_type:complete
VKIVFLVIDALPNQLVGVEWTPNLWKLIKAGGWNSKGGQAVLSTATYPNHATFITGRSPASHGIFVNKVWDGKRFRIASDVGPQGDTLFKAMKRKGISSSAIVGDHHLIGVIGAENASLHWPPQGKRADVELDEFRYATNTAVLNAIDQLDALSADFAFLHLNEPDTVCHIHGPDADETKIRVKRTDEVLGGLIDRLQPNWEDTIIIVVSDHDQEFVVDWGFDLAESLNSRGLPGLVEYEGTSAVIHNGPSLNEVLQIPEIEGAISLDHDHTYVWGKPGHVFGPWLDGLFGSHGSPRCLTQVAVVSGGHVEAQRIAKLISNNKPNAQDWAQHINHLLNLDLKL